ncbi:ras-specific guanine nucleotide-releasing factor RalGPS2-like isoform X2 [Artemia franciscana]|uniref:ras-specific guanine nucleotide-releasing factor RalGPS2-like isoform X2 n=1 Tax=Artemia franciscana TaxID=6661 RepID=UPI0032DB9216
MTSESEDSEEDCSNGKKYSYATLRNSPLSANEVASSLSTSLTLFSLSCIGGDNVFKLPSESKSSPCRSKRKVLDSKLKRNQSFQVQYTERKDAVNAQYSSRSLPAAARTFKFSCMDSRTSDIDSPINSELGDDSPFTKNLNLLNVPAEDVASELTLFSFEVFSQIQPDELSCHSDSGKTRREMAPNIAAFTDQFNVISLWVVQEILNHEDPKLRADTIVYFIKVAKKLSDLRNFHAKYAVLSGLNYQAIYRLKLTWQYVSKKDQQLFRKLLDVFSSEENFSKLREVMDCLKLPCIPYLGLYLTDLVYLKDLRTSPWGSSNRELSTNNILRTITSYQTSDYSFLRARPRIRDHLLSLRYIEGLLNLLEEDQYRRSLKLEPNESRTSQSKPNTPDESPSKSSLNSARFIRGHKKSSSVGSNTVKPLTNQLRFGKLSLEEELRPSLEDSLNSRHLIDDSLIGDYSSSATNSLPSPSSSTPSSPALIRAIVNRSLDSLAEYEIPPLPEMAQPLIEGCVRRRAIKKRGKAPGTSFWGCFWAQVRHRQLLLFPKKLFTNWPIKKGDFKEKSLEPIHLTEWEILPEGDSHPEGIVMTNTKTGDVYKYRVADSTAANNWLDKLTLASRISREDSVTSDLIEF